MVNPFRRAVAPYSREAYDVLRTRLQRDMPLVLDSACGTGESTVALARLHPLALVVGVDQSAERLARGLRKTSPLPANALLLRADVTDIWTLLDADDLRLSHHYLLYPNPWPKPRHLQRRWHGHPRWPALLALGGRLDLRTNWITYAQEFACALQLCGHAASVARHHAGSAGLTPFERKYAASGHALWSVTATLPMSPAPVQAGNTPVDR